MKHPTATGLLLALTVTLALTEKGVKNTPSSDSHHSETQLNTMLYGFLPLPTGVADYVAANVNIKDTVVNVVSSADTDFDLYDTEDLKELLGDGHNAVDVVEVDAVVLPWLVANGLATAIPSEVINTNDYIGAARSSVDIDTFGYAGVPSYVCAFVTLSTSVNITGLRSQAELVALLDGLDPDVTKLAAQLGYLSAPLQLYLSGLATFQPKWAFSPSAFNGTLDSFTVHGLKTLFDMCKSADGVNPCLGAYSGSYCNSTEDITDGLLDGDVAITVGFGEQLWELCEGEGHDIDAYVSPLLLGNAASNVWFTDAFVINRHCTGDCYNAAVEFIHYMNSPTVKEAISLSPNNVSGSPWPRYLLPAQQSFWNLPSVLENSNYKQLAAIFTGMPSSIMPTTQSVDVWYDMEVEVREKFDVSCMPPSHGHFMSHMSPEGGHVTRRRRQWEARASWRPPVD